MRPALVTGSHQAHGWLCSRNSRNWRFPIVHSSTCPKRRADDGARDLRKRKWADCRWLRPVLVGSFEFLEWTGENHLRHTRFMGLREGAKARDVTRET